MVNSYHEYKVESVKAERYTLQSSNPMHPSKSRVNFCHIFSYACMLAGSHYFLWLLMPLYSKWLYRSYGRYIPVQGMIFQLPQQTFIIRMTIQDAIIECSVFSSHPCYSLAHYISGPSLPGHSVAKQQMLLRYSNIKPWWNNSKRWII